MPGTTSRLALPYALASDNESAYPTAVDLPKSTTLDNAATYYEGTLVSRPGAGAVEHGRFYRTTDAGVETLSWGDGSVWLPLGLIPASTSASASAVSGQALIVTGSSAVTITLPLHANGQMVAVMNRSTGGTTVSGSNTYGLGLSAASSFPLGPVGASAVLLDDGTNWNLIAGQQDSGWVALSMASNVSVSSGPPLNARLTGNIVRLASVLITSATVNTFFTVPASMKPASQQVINPSLHVPSQPSSVYPLVINTSTGVASAFYADDGALATNNKLGLDGLTYPIS